SPHGWPSSARCGRGRGSSATQPTTSRRRPTWTSGGSSASRGSPDDRRTGAQPALAHLQRPGAAAPVPAGGAGDGAADRAERLRRPRLARPGLALAAGRRLRRGGGGYLHHPLALPSRPALPGPLELPRRRAAGDRPLPAPADLGAERRAADAGGHPRLFALAADLL